jgi:hypothetical protein
MSTEPKKEMNMLALEKVTGTIIETSGGVVESRLLISIQMVGGESNSRIVLSIDKVPNTE